MRGARSHYVRALSVALHFGDLRWIGNTRCNLGLVLSDRGESEEALVELDAALKIARQLGHLRLECIVRWNSGIAYVAQGRIAEAVASYEEARRIAVRLGDRQSTALLDAELEKAHTSRVT